MNEWGTLRKFNHLLDFVVEQWVPYGLQLFNEVNLISVVIILCRSWPLGNYTWSATKIFQFVSRC